MKSLTAPTTPFLSNGCSTLKRSRPADRSESIACFFSTDTDHMGRWISSSTAGITRLFPSDCRHTPHISPSHLTSQYSDRRSIIIDQQPVDSAARISGSINFSRADFLAALPEIRRNASKPHTTQSGWRKAGIIPFNPNMVLDQLESDDEGSLSHPAVHANLDQPSSDLVIPLSARTFAHIQGRMEGFLDRGESPPSPLARRIGRGAVELAFAHELLENRCKDMTTTARGRDRRAGGMRQGAGFGGMMEAADWGRPAEGTASIFPRYCRCCRE